MAAARKISNVTQQERDAAEINMTSIFGKFADGTTIIKEGEEGSTFYILLEGECSATQEDSEHVQKEVRTYKSGEHFGELALLHGEGSRRAATVQAKTDCKCILLDKLSFERLLGPVQGILARDAENYAKHV